MKVRPLNDERELLAIVPAWRELFARVACPQVVQSPVWALEWWREFGGDEGRAMHALAFEEPEGRLVGLALLCSRRVLRRRVVPIRRLEVWMSGEPREHEIFSEYLGLLAEAGAEQSVARALADALHEGRVGPFEQLLIARGAHDDPVLVALAEALRERGFEVARPVRWSSAYAKLPDTWEAYLAGRSKNQRHQLRLSLKELDAWAAGAPVELCAASDRRSALDALAILRALHGARWEKEHPGGVFASPRFSRFHERVLPELVEQGLGELIWLRVGERPVAAFYNLVVGGRTQAYLGGRVVEGVPHRLSLGTAAHALAIQRCIARGDREYDLLSGGATYKERFTTDVRELSDLVAWSPSLRGRLTGTVVRVAERVLSLGRGVPSRERTTRAVE